MDLLPTAAPFLVESLLAGVGRVRAEVQRVIHPIVVMRRTDDGKLAEVLTAADSAAPPPGTLVESWIHLDLMPIERYRCPGRGTGPVPGAPSSARRLHAIAIR